MSQEDDYDDLPSKQRGLQPWLIVVFIGIALVMIVPMLLIVLFIVAFGLSNM